MNKFKTQEQKEQVARFLCRLALELRKNTKLVWNDRYQKFMIVG
jgi:hypothetical protein